MSIWDKYETPGYWEWESLELRTLMLGCSLKAVGDGLWTDPDDELCVMVTPVGLFAGWTDSCVREPDGRIRRFGDTRHVPRGLENELEEAIEELRKLRLAAMVQCRDCGETFTPGWISERRCAGCRDEAGSASA